MRPTTALDRPGAASDDRIRVGVSPEVAAHARLLRTVAAAADTVGSLRDGPCDVALLAAGWELEKLGSVARAVVAVGEMPTLDDHRRALGCGATGVVTWDVAPDVLRATLVSAASGRATVPTWVLGALAVRLEEPREGFSLTSWQLQLLRDLAGGRTEAELARERACSARQIRRHVAEIWAQMEVSGRTQGLVRAARWGLVETTEGP